MDSERISEIEKKLADVEFYSPTMPLHWSEYHAMLRELLAVVKRPPAGHGAGISPNTKGSHAEDGAAHAH